MERLVDLRNSIRRLLHRLDGGYVRLLYAGAIVTTLVMLLHRSVPWLASAALLLALVCVWSTLPARVRPVRVYAGEVATMTFVLLLCLVSVEIALRWLIPPGWGPIRYWQPDREYNAITKPGARGYAGVYAPRGVVEYFPLAFSSQGFRDREFGPKADGEIRVLMLGDSFTMGHVESEDSIPKQLERICAARLPEFRISVVNAGMGNAGPVEELGLLRRRGLALDPDLVILQFFTGNDLQNALAAEGRWLRAEPEDVQADIQRWQRVKAAEMAFVWDRELRSRLAMYDIVATRVIGIDAIPRWLQSFRFFPPSSPFVRMTPAHRKPTLEPALVEWYPELAQGLSIAERCIQDMRNDCATRKVEFLMYCLPPKPEMFDEVWQVDIAPSAEVYERLKACRILDAFCEREGIRHFSVHEAISAAGSMEKSYYRFDGHLRAEGNTVVAGRIFEAAILPFVRQRGHSTARLVR